MLTQLSCSQVGPQGQGHRCARPLPPRPLEVVLLTLLPLDRSHECRSAASFDSLARATELTHSNADDLIKRDVFQLPSPFPLLLLYSPTTRPTVSAQPYATHQGPTVPATTSPFWATSASFEVEVEEGAWGRVRIHDHAKWNKKGQVRPLSLSNLVRFERTALTCSTCRATSAR